MATMRPATSSRPTLLLTGAAGFIGTHLLPLLCDYDVVALTRNACPCELPNVRWLITDLSDPGAIKRLPPQIDNVIHLAQSRHFRDFPTHAADIFEVNVGATMRLLEWSRSAGAGRFVLASSGGIYGGGSDGFREDHSIGGTGPLGFYLSTKHCAELLACNYTDALAAVALRFFFVYGPGQHASMLIPRLIESVRCGRPITLSGAEGIRINPVHVFDAARAIVASLNLNSSQQINVAGPEVRSLRSIIQVMGDSLNRAPVLQVGPASGADLIGDIQKMSRLLGRPTISPEHGIANLCVGQSLGSPST